LRRIDWGARKWDDTEDLARFGVDDFEIVFRLYGCEKPAPIGRRTNAMDVYSDFDILDNLQRLEINDRNRHCQLGHGTERLMP
jgi:hypothetical protein